MFTGFAAYWVMKEAKSTEKGYISFWSLAKGYLIRYNTPTRSISPYPEAHPIIL